MLKQLKSKGWLLAMCLVLASGICAFAADGAETLTITGDGVEKEVSYTLAELKAMQEGTFSGVYTMRTLVEPHSDEYKGMSVEYLFNQAKLKQNAKSVQIICSDGVSMKFAVDEIAGKTYINEVNDTELKVILAYEKAGKALVEGKTSQGYDKNIGNDGGPLRLMIGQSVKEERNSPKCLQNVVEIIVSAKDMGTQFTDLGNFYSWAEDAIYSLVDKGVLSGVGDGKFAPEKNVTRSEFAKMISLAYEIKPIESPSGIFSDVPKDRWDAPYVEAAAAKGLLQGTGEAVFHPSGEISRNEVAVLMVRAMGLEAQAKAFSGPIEAFNDEAKIPDWSKGSVAVANDKGLFDNIAVSFFNGDAKIKRAEAAVIIYKSLKSK